METDESDGKKEFSVDVIKVEFEEDVQDVNFEFDANLAGLTFSDAEITKDPLTGGPICMLCLEKLTQDGITDHMVNVHKYRKIFFKCWNCHQIFSDKNYLTAHKLTCQQQKTVKKKISIKHIIKEATERGQTNMCPICLVEISKEDTLISHFEKEHKVEEPPKPQAPVSCPICHKVFKSKMTLGQHTRHVHKSKQKLFPCPECEKKFSAQNLLANHVRNVHPKHGRIHKCEECGKGFKSHQSLYQHVKYVHARYKPKKHKAKERQTSLDALDTLDTLDEDDF